jgi:hypothetical protein
MTFDDLDLVEFWRRLDTCPPYDVARIAADYLNVVEGVESVGVWAVDFAGHRLVDMVGSEPDKAVWGSGEGECHRERSLKSDDTGWLIPMHVRARDLGVLSLRMSEHREARADEPTEQLMLSIGGLLAGAIEASIGQSDEVPDVRGAARLSLPAAGGDRPAGVSGAGVAEPGGDPADGAAAEVTDGERAANGEQRKRRDGW